MEILNDNMEVRFNKKYSNGTAVVRCTEPMSNHQYYWEVKMNYPVYGTDIVSKIIYIELYCVFIPNFCALFVTVHKVPRVVGMS